MQKPILVTGGTGTLGRAVVRRLLDDGREVRVLSRGPRPANVQHGWVTGDLRTGAGIDAATSEVDAIVHCATTLGRKDVAATQRLIDAARRNGVPHLVYISIVGVDQVPIPYYRAKLEAEELVAASGLPWTILRTTQFHGLIARITSAQRRSPVVAALAGVSFQPIDVRDVAERLAELAAGSPAGRVADMGGPEVRSHRDLARAYLDSTGRRRILLPVRLPIAAFAACRRGGHLAPDNAVGRITFDDFLAGR
ncbi:Nucleoside-diphosphate-sugar epimerase [Saccharopolyspora shandongensis]|uniref:Nucleoside-diphosphate-sugar epimerase n=1 Tax=Saccharopolyspora shandongensis TaxID=418495 RepID=A0A1H3AHT1_9PSEU|nr:NAD(P)H-binding protein [Saccharopolyspora shandongensis]SDX29145.1 Nucleoside-diphosphate-sugar epimerase [Saccharopolyspora shandongensis]